MKTKMKKLALAAATLFFALNAFAQLDFKGGIVGGIITGPVKIENLGDRFTEVVNGNNINGFEAGIFVKPSLGIVYVKPMALYQFRTGSVTFTQAAASGQQTTTFSMHKAEFPLLVGLNILGPLYVEAGPSYNYLFAVTDKYNETTVAINQSAIGYRVGVGAELGPVLLSLSMAGASYTLSDSKATFREPYKFIFGLGFMLGGKKMDRQPD